ncbi:MAG: HAD-IB family phosphatase [Candidatus Berkelbacteria bacterium]|nr:HAD-IB family phosphatase [Candidatus Berkelbacteria bacterium]
MRIPGISAIKEALAFKQLSVIIPSFNEAKTVAKVVEEVLKLKEVGELILVDDGSTDKTEKKIEKSKKDSRFIYIKHPKNRGKGAALKTGIKRAKNEAILLLDADLMNITSSKIKKIFMPVLRDEVDVSRASFSRERGRITEFAIKPMMKILYPTTDFTQPISGQVCAKKSFLNRINLEKDYGVDIGILLDAIHEGQRIIEVDIGWLEHKKNEDQKVAEMAQKVLETMIKKAGLIQPKYKLVVFTFDRTLIQDKTLAWINNRLGISREMTALQNELSEKKITFKAYVQKTATLFRGKDLRYLKFILKNAPLVEYAPEVVTALKRRKYEVAIVSSNFSPIVIPVAESLGIEKVDCIYFEEKNGELTGKATPASLDKWASTSLEEAFPKAFQRIIARAKAKASETVMIVNSPAWIPVLAKAGFSIAYRPNTGELKETADKTIAILPEILALIE